MERLTRVIDNVQDDLSMDFEPDLWAAIIAAEYQRLSDTGDTP